MGDPPTIPLALSEINHAAFAGYMRQCAALRLRMRLDPRRNDTGWERHINGAIGEYVVAKALGITWTPHIGGSDAQMGDVAGLQVRCVTQPGDHLCLPDAAPDGDYVLVVLSYRERSARIPGWINTIDGKHPVYWQERRGYSGAYYVPQQALHPWSRLLAEQPHLTRGGVAGTVGLPE